MTSSARPAAEATAPMAQTPELPPPEPQPPEPKQQAPAQVAHSAEPPAPDCPPPVAPAAHRPRRRVAAVEKASSGDRPLVIALVSLIGLLLGLPMYLINDEVNEIEHKVDALEAKIEAKIDARFAAQDAKIDARFAQVDARFDSLESDLGEINLKLTALIAALNATDEVDAALEGRLTAAGTADPVDEPR